MSAEINYFEQGQKDCRSYYTGQATTSLTVHVRAEDAMRLYWPCETEMMSQMATPLPKPRQKWLAGFKKEQIVIKAEMQIKCLYCNQEYSKEVIDD